MKKRRRPVRREEDPLEQGAIIKYGRHLIKAALVYPNTYKAGMSSLGFQAVYRLANEHPDVSCERVFLPGHRQKAVAVKSIETGLPLEKFDLILFSISFENDFIHLVRLLRETGIPLRSSDRNHIHPLVAAGGVACFLNPEPIAPFMDLFLLGEAELLLPPFFDLFRAHPGKAALLETIQENLPGAYVPARHSPILYNAPAPDPPPAPIRVGYQESLKSAKTRTCILTSDTAFKDIFLMETLRGCPHGCRFCTAGFIYRPPRPYSLETLKTVMDEADGKTDKIGLVSSAILDHPDIKALCQYGRDKGFTLSFSSLRADRLDADIIGMLSRSRIKTATIAPEAGSERMRRIINKKLDRETILAAAAKLVENNIPNLRLYFMIGLPFETDRDALAIADLAKEIKYVFLEASRKKKKIGTITLSINPFIPKPCTPFQWAAMADPATLRHRLNLIRDKLKTTANVTVNAESLKTSRINALLSLGDRRTAGILETALEKGWARTLKQHRDYCETVIHSEKPLPSKDDPDTAPALPWSFLEHPVSTAFLAREWHRAKDEKESVACPMNGCKICRICRR